VLVVPDHGAGLRPDREHAVGVKRIALAPVLRIVRPGIADPPVDEVELRVVRPHLPGRAAADLPRIGYGIGRLRPGLVTGLARRRDGVPAPQLLAGLRIPAHEEAARGVLAAGGSRDQHAVGDERGADALVAFLMLGELLLPDLLAGLHVERDYMRIQGRAIEL